MEHLISYHITTLTQSQPSQHQPTADRVNYPQHQISHQGRRKTGIQKAKTAPSAKNASRPDVAELPVEPARLKLKNRIPEGGGALDRKFSATQHRRLSGVVTAALTPYTHVKQPSSSKRSDEIGGRGEKGEKSSTETDINPLPDCSCWKMAFTFCCALLSVMCACVYVCTCVVATQSAKVCCGMNFYINRRRPAHSYSPFIPFLRTPPSSRTNPHRNNSKKKMRKEKRVLHEQENGFYTSRERDSHYKYTRIYARTHTPTPTRKW